MNGGRIFPWDLPTESGVFPCHLKQQYYNNIPEGNYATLTKIVTNPLGQLTLERLDCLWGQQDISQATETQPTIYYKN
jgi:hypothetical protein